MRVVRTVLTVMIGAALGWAAGHVVCTALFLWLPRAVAALLADILRTETIATSVFGGVFALVGAATGWSFNHGPWTPSSTGQRTW